MGEFMISGQDAEAFIQNMTTNDVSRITVGQAQYTLMCDDNGGTVDDLLVYKLSSDRFMLVVNASNIDKDLQWLHEHVAGDVVIRNVSAETALIALRTCRREHLVKGNLGGARRSPSFHFIQNAQVCGHAALLSRTGYTGEDGFEIYCSAGDAQDIWRGLLTAGEDHGLIPAGLGARDTLRFEAKLPLYGQELSSTISPLEASLGYFVKLDSGDFIGRKALQQQKQDGVPRKLVGIELIDRGIPRSHYLVFNGSGEPIGEVTSGTQSPSLKRNLGLALIETPYASLDSEVWVEIRGKKLKAKVVKTPFYKEELPYHEASLLAYDRSRSGRHACRRRSGDHRRPVCRYS